MTQETHQCQNCKQDFTVEPEDFSFYEKMKVPAPTFCFSCRLQRRLSFKNERTLYKRRCDLCRRDMVAEYPTDVLFPIYCPECWWSDKWSAVEYGRDYDFSKPFFEQYKELQHVVPRIGLNIDYPRTIGGEYMNLTGPAKNCYLIFLAEDDESCMYSYSLFHCKDTTDCTKVGHATKCYELFNCEHCYHTIFSVGCRDCVDVSFSKNLTGCSQCFGCVNLTNKKYHIFNEPYSEEGYKEAIRQFTTSSYKELVGLKQRVRQFWGKFPTRFMDGYKNTDVSGNYIYHSKNVHHSFEVIGGVDDKYCHVINMAPTSDCYDYGDWGNNASYVYDSVNCGENINSVRFSTGGYVGQNWDYCDVVFSGDNLFGCVSLLKKSNCILNKEFPKETFKELREKIVKHMTEMPYVDQKGRVYRYGEFFPSELSPFPYRDTAAFEFFPLSGTEIKTQGYHWRPEEKREHIPTINADALPDRISDVTDAILDEVIGCVHAGTCNERCTTAFKIVPQELAFYREMNLPLPHLCHNCRHYERSKFMNPPKLWKRACQCAGAKSENGVYQNTAKHFHENEHCPNEFETSYVSERPEMIYCETCYLKEVV